MNKYDEELEKAGSAAGATAWNSRGAAAESAWAARGAVLRIASGATARTALRNASWASRDISETRRKQIKMILKRIKK